MDKIKVTKAAVNLVASAGIGHIVKTVVKNNVPTENVLQQVAVPVGSFVLASMITDATEQHTEAKIDKAVAWYRETFHNETA